MKKILIKVFILFSASTCYAQWVQVDSLPLGNNCGYPSPPGEVLFSPDVVFYIIGRGHCSPQNPAYYSVIRSTDSFKTFTGVWGCGGMQDGYLYDLDIISQDTIYIFDSCMGFRKTYDGGTSWTSISTSHQRPNEMFFVNSQLAYGFSGDTLYMYSNDSLYSVTEVNSFNSSFAQFYFADSLTGIAFVQPSEYDYIIDRVMKTINGGINWTEIILDPNRKFSSLMNPLNDSIYFLRDDSGYVYKSIDRGNSWLPAFQKQDFYPTDFLSENKIYGIYLGSSQESQLMFTTDGGQQWKTGILPSIGQLHSFKMFNDSVGYLVEWTQLSNWYQSLVYKTTTGILPIQQTNLSTDHLIISPSPGFGSFNLSIPTEFRNVECSFSIYNSVGQLIRQMDLYTSEDKLPLQLYDYPADIYFATLTNGKNFLTGKVMFYTLKK